MSNSCHHITIAKNGVASVQRCTQCDCISIHLGPTTVRIDAQTLEALWSVLGEATAQLRAEHRPTQLQRGVA
ncbi:MAG TPA: hypothetical protein VFQ61_22225 [Polyangiaceae bacterium]|nr:hypothetical protein [Polyangiaceae bacterium]